MRLIFISIHLCLVSSLFAQTEQSSELLQQELYFPISVAPLSVNFDYLLLDNESNPFIKSLQFDTLFNANELSFKKQTQLSAFSFNQDKSEETFIGLGSYEHFKTNFTYNRKDKVLLTFEVGLLKQNTIQNFNDVDFHLSMRTLIEYKFNKTFSAYTYGQYISSPLNKDNTSFDSFSPMNRLFLQTEIGTGLRASYKNFKTDVGMRSIRGSQFNQIKSINTMDTKITIGF